ncbi:MAG: metallophosphoesterase [Planctomycetes bacterium]|nr:metallophosphoesterase [Planctomycetota bacterium]
MKNRTRWLRRGLWLAGFGCLWLNVLDDPPLRTGAYVQNVTTEAATIARILAEPGQLHLTVTDADGEVVASAHGDARRRHALRVEGLQPGTRYEYELATRDGGSARGSFRTAPARDDAPVRFAFCGDSGDQPWWVWLQRTPILHLPARWGWLPTKSAVTRVGAAMAGYRPDFALHLGDVVYPKGLHGHYASGFFRPFADLLRAAPVYPVLGNHDVMNAAGVQILANFEMPTNPVTGDERSYSFAWGPVRVIALDCNTFFTGDHYRPGHPTHTFLLQELERCTEPWIVVASHFPMRSASRQGDNPELLVSLLPELEAWQVSLYLSGHDHCYQRFGPSEALAVPLVVSGGGGKRLYDISENPRARREAMALEKAYHWCSAEVAGGVMRVVAHGVDRKQLDAFELHLPSGDALERLRARNPGRARRIEGL